MSTKSKQIISTRLQKYDKVLKNKSIPFAKCIKIWKPVCLYVVQNSVNSLKTECFPSVSKF